MDWAGETPTPQELIGYFFIWKSLKHFFLLSVPSVPLRFVKKFDFDKEF
jgi:hypothetical protein